MSKYIPTGQNPTAEELREVERILNLSPAQQRNHPSSVPADRAKLSHINTYGRLPEFYFDKSFTCQNCGKMEIWKAGDQKWYYEEAKGHIDAKAVECHDCRQLKKQARLRSG
ncbi:MAG TPA: zinc-ribbon domain containing protein [Verrucomicrobiae bacterium]|jgi:hypothetical protein